MTDFPLTSRLDAYCWTERYAGPLVHRMDGQQIEAQLYGWDYAWWKGLTKEIRWDLINRP